MQMLEAGLQCRLRQFAQGKLVRIVADILKHSVEVVLIEDQFDQALSLDWELAFNFRCGFFVITPLLLLDLVLGIVLVIFVVSLEEGVLALFGRLATIFPFMAGFVFEFLVVLSEGTVQIEGAHSLDLTEVANAAPARMNHVIPVLVE